MTRAVNLLGLKNTVMIISGPSLHLVQAVSRTSDKFTELFRLTRFPDWRIGLLLPRDRSCQSRMGHDRILDEAGHGTWITSAE